MVWLSSVCHSGECSAYFDIRDAEAVFRGGVFTGIVRGHVGDGGCENWAEVTIGAEESARVLPYWDETGRIERLTDAIDDRLLEAQLIREAKTYLQQTGIFASLKTLLQPDVPEPVADEQNNRLAA